METPVGNDLDQTDTTSDFADSDGANDFTADVGGLSDDVDALDGI